MNNMSLSYSVGHSICYFTTINELRFLKIGRLCHDIFGYIIKDRGRSISMKALIAS